MSGDIFFQRRSSYFSGCMSPSCVPVHEEYSRIHVSRDAAAAASHRRRKLRRLLRKIVNEGKSIYGPPVKPLTFQYDAVSYSQNFDEGGHGDADYCQKVFRDLKWPQPQHVVHNK